MALAKGTTGMMAKGTPNNVAKSHGGFHKKASGAQFGQKKPNVKGDKNGKGK